LQICVPMGAVPIHYFTCSDIFAVDASFSHISCSDVLVPLFFESISLIFLAFSSIVKKSKSSAVYAFKDLCYFAHKKIDSISIMAVQNRTAIKQAANWKGWMESGGRL